MRGSQANTQNNSGSQSRENPVKHDALAADQQTHNRAPRENLTEKSALIVGHSPALAKPIVRGQENLTALAKPIERGDKTDWQVPGTPGNKKPANSSPSENCKRKKRNGCQTCPWKDGKDKKGEIFKIVKLILKIVAWLIAAILEGESQ